MPNLKKTKVKKEKLIKCSVTTSQEDKPYAGYLQETVGNFMLPEKFLKLLLDNNFKKHLQLNYKFKKQGPFYYFNLTKNEHDAKIEILVSEIINLFFYWKISHGTASKTTEVKNKIKEITKLVSEFNTKNTGVTSGFLKNIQII